MMEYTLAADPFSILTVVVASSAHQCIVRFSRSGAISKARAGRLRRRATAEIDRDIADFFENS
jgi:hypothetical protein